MDHRDEGDLERTLRLGRSEARPDFVETLAAEIRGELRKGRRRSRSWRLAFVAAVTAVGIAALGAVGATGSVTSALADAVSITFSAQDEVHLVLNSPAQDQYAKCNSGRGNLSETETGTRQTDSTTLVNPHEGGTGPGPYPTDDCDPGNSGDQNRGGD